MAVVQWVLAALLLGGVIGYRVGADSVVADQARAEDASEVSRDATMGAAGGELAKQEKTNVVVRERLVRVVVDRPVYRECAADADGLRLTNAALTGDTSALELPAGDAELP